MSKYGKRVHLLGCCFQAEDGIRDVAVTGVQTCALPISSRPERPRRTRVGAGDGSRRRAAGRADRKSVVEGKRGDLGGRRIIKKNTKLGGKGVPDRILREILQQIDRLAANCE